MDKNKKLFPQRLWDLVHDERHSRFIRWSDDGQRVYLNRNEFESCYLRTQNNQFHTQKAISFVRQMNMYGFKKVDDTHYENDNFKRGCHHLIKHMVRRNSNRPQVHASSGAAAAGAGGGGGDAGAQAAAAAMAATISPFAPLSLTLSDGQSLGSISQRDFVSGHTTNNNSGRSSASTTSGGVAATTAAAAAHGACSMAPATADATVPAVGVALSQQPLGALTRLHHHESLLVDPSSACRARTTGQAAASLQADQRFARTASLLGALSARAQANSVSPGSLYEQLLYWYQLLAFRQATEQ